MQSYVNIVNPTMNTHLHLITNRNTNTNSRKHAQRAARGMKREFLTVVCRRIGFWGHSSVSWVGASGPPNSRACNVLPFQLVAIVVTLVAVAVTVVVRPFHSGSHAAIQPSIHQRV